MVKFKGWIFNYERFEPPFKIKEILNILLDFLLEILMLLPFSITVILLLIFNNLKDKHKRAKKRFFLGSNSVITLKLLKQVFDNEFDLTFFCFKDEYSFLNSIEVITIDKLSPIFNYKFTYKFWKYAAFFWALKNFDVYILYFDGGLLERSIIYWRLEPLIYKVFGKKIIMVPYGGDVWYICGDPNIFRSYTNTISRKRYFLLDNKRIKRTYLWCRYSDSVISCIDYIRFVPRVDIITYGGQILRLEDYDYFFENKDGVISVIHIANDEFRKGTFFINECMKQVTKKIKNISYNYYVGVNREKLYELFNKAHIFIEQITYGFISYTSIEAMLTGKIVVLYLDEEINELYKLIDYQYYEKFFNEFPGIVVNNNDFLNKISDLVKDKESLRQLSLKSHAFAIDYVRNNIDAWRVILKSFEEDRSISDIINGVNYVENS